MGNRVPSRPQIQNVVTQDVTNIIVAVLQEISQTFFASQILQVNCVEHNRARDQTIQTCLQRNADRSTEDIQRVCYKPWENLRCEANQIFLNQAIYAFTSAEQISTVETATQRALNLQLESTIKQQNGLLNVSDQFTTSVSQLVTTAMEIFAASWMNYASNLDVVQRLQVNGAPVSFVTMNQTVDFLNETFQRNPTFVALTSTIAIEVRQAIVARDRTFNILIWVTTAIVGLAIIILLFVVAFKLAAKANASSATRSIRINVER